MADHAIQIMPYTTRQQAGLALAVIAQQAEKLFDVARHDPALFLDSEFSYGVKEMALAMLNLVEQIRRQSEGEAA